MRPKLKAGSHSRTIRKPQLAKIDHSGEERFQHLLEHLHVGVVLLGPRAEVQYANQAAADIFGLTLKEALGKTSEDLNLAVVREDGSEYPFPMRPGPRSIESGESVRGEVMGCRRPGTGELFWIYCSSVPQFRADGSLRQVIMTLTEITERKRIEEELHQLSGRLLGLQEEERRRIARDLHDSFAQRLLGIGLNLAQLSKDAKKWGSRERRVLAEARKMTKILARETRSLSYLLHPPLIDDMGLVSAIKEYASGYSNRSGIELEVDLPPDLNHLPKSFEIAIFRVIQEALGNIQKHSGSPTGVIRIQKEAGQITIEVNDRGRGISPKDAESGGALGIGILGMRERIRQLGGRLVVAPAKPGTTVRAVFPLPREAKNAAPNPDRR